MIAHLDSLLVDRFILSEFFGKSSWCAGSVHMRLFALQLAYLDRVLHRRHIIQVLVGPKSIVKMGEFVKFIPDFP